MTIFIFIFITELFLLSLLSRKLTQGLYVLFFRLFGSKTIAMTILIILLFPGTVVHELAHLFVAEILRVRTGKLTLVPESLEEAEIRTGSVSIAHTDPFRRTLIGLAPVYVGIAALAAISSLPVLPILTFYGMFAISNSMFSSKEDMKGVIPFIITVGLFIAAGYYAGFRVGLPDALLAGWNPVVESLVGSLGIVLGVNLLVLFATSLLLVILPSRHR